jgi:membrane protein DedA with SNARE-associated domain
MLEMARQVSLGLLTFFMSLEYVGVFIAMALEGSGVPIPFPGVILLAFTGYQVLRGRLDLMIASMTAATGFSVGAFVLYLVARVGGPAVLRRLSPYIQVSDERLRGVQRWFQHYGLVATFVARITPGARIYISVAAGLARMRQSFFLISTFTGSFLWATTFITIGLLLGPGWDAAATLIGQSEWVIVVVGLLVMAVAIARRVRARLP